MDRQDLDDTYDLLSPVRRSGGYSESFESSDEESEAKFRSDNILTSSVNSHSSANFKSRSTSAAIPLPKYASTAKYNVKPSIRSFPSPKPRKKVITRHTSALKEQPTHDTTRDLMRIPQEGDKEDISVWEDWLIKKLQLEREKIISQKHSEKAAKEEARRLQREKDLNKKKAEMKHQQWCEEKLLKLKLQKTIDRREKLLKEELKNQEKEQIHIKAEQAYEKWSQKQDEKEHERKEKEKEMKRQEQLKREEKQKINEECFQNWLKKANEKQASPRSKQVAASEYPSPSFKNPTPWVGPMSDRDTRESVRRQHKQMVAEKHAAIRRTRQRPQTAVTKRKGLVKNGPDKGKSVLICRPATASPLFYNVPNRSSKNSTYDRMESVRGRS